jgi:hypothetical protein
MARTDTSAGPAMTAATHPGWVLVAPDRRPYAWYAYDQALSYDETSAAARFEPDTPSRNAMLHGGWTVRAGRAVELACGTGGLAKVSA